MFSLCFYSFALLLQFVLAFSVSPSIWSSALLFTVLTVVCSFFQEKENLTVGTPVTQRPPHSPGRAVFPHPVLRLYSLSRKVKSALHKTKRCPGICSYPYPKTCTDTAAIPPIESLLTNSDFRYFWQMLRYITN